MEGNILENRVEIEKPNGKLGVLLPGLGAVATTFIAGIEAVKKQIALPIGSLTQMGTIRLGKRTEKRVPKIKNFIELPELEDIVFAGWDIFEDNIYEAALKAGVLNINKTVLTSISQPRLLKKEGNCGSCN